MSDDKKTASKLRTVGLTHEASIDWKEILAHEDAKAPAGTRAKASLVLARILREERERLEREAKLVKHALREADFAGRAGGT